MAEKQNFYVKVKIDDREKNKLHEEIILDKRIGKDGICICEKEICRLYTGDINFQIKTIKDGEWKDICLVIENKYKSDLFSTLTTTEPYGRFKKELQRVKEYKLDMYLIHNYDFKDIKNGIIYLKNKGILGESIEYYTIFLERYIEITNQIKVIQCPEEEYGNLVRRIIKNYIKKFKKTIDKK